MSRRVKVSRMLELGFGGPLQLPDGGESGGGGGKVGIKA